MKVNFKISLIKYKELALVCLSIAYSLTLTFIKKVSKNLNIIHKKLFHSKQLNTPTSPHVNYINLIFYIWVTEVECRILALLLKSSAWEVVINFKCNVLSLLHLSSLF